MRSYDEYHEILTLWEDGFNKLQIATMTGIPRATVRDCINKFGDLATLENYKDDRMEINGESSVAYALKTMQVSQEMLKAYAYLFGLYLGDGTISKMGRVYRLRIFLDMKYPLIIQACKNAMQTLLVNNEVGIVDMKNMAVVNCYYNFWPQVFPQAGAGKKHNRSIIIEEWQQKIIDLYPLEFFRGLYHSDGSRSRNVVNGKDYPRYFFSNYSIDIQALYIATVDKLGLQVTQTNANNFAISRRDDVVWLDEHVGAKA
jgi:hypothetical protein